MAISAVRKNVYDKSREKGVMFFSSSSVQDCKYLLESNIYEILVSIFYLRKNPSFYETEFFPELKRNGGLFMIDSGGHTYLDMFYRRTATPEMYKEDFWIPKIEEYVEYLDSHSDSIFSAANYDMDFFVGRKVIDKWNDKYFRPLEKKMNIIYVIHESYIPAEADPYGYRQIEDYCKNYKYVGASGTRHFIENAGRIFTSANRYGTRVHGFGWTSIPLLKRFPFFSVDSSVSYDTKVIVRVNGNVEHIEIGDLFYRLNKGTSFLYEERRLTPYMETPALRNDNKVRWMPLSSVVKHAVRKKMLRVHIEGGRFVDVTEDHSLIVLDKDGSHISISANDLTMDTLLLVPKNLYFSRKRNKYSEKFLLFLGLWLGDGYIDEKRHSVSLSGCSLLEIRCIAQDIADMFGAKLSVMGKHDCRITNKTLLSIMKELGFTGKSYSKKIPDSILSMDMKDICAFLQGYFSADGTSCNRSISTSTVSKNLKDDLVMLLGYLGIHTSVTIHKSRKYSIRGKTGNARELYSITIRDHESRERFMEKIGFCVAYKHNSAIKDLHDFECGEQLWAKRSGVPCVLSKSGSIKFKRDSVLLSKLKETQVRCNRDYNKNNFSSSVLDSDVWFYKVVKIEKLPLSEEVFDLEVPDAQNFIANGIVVHNTTWLGGVRYGTSYRYDGKNFRVTSYKKKYLRKADKLRCRDNNVDYEALLRDERSSVNMYNLIGWKGARNEYLKYCNKLTNKTVVHYC